MKKIDSEEIVKMRKDGLSYSQICEKTGFSKGTVSKYCRGLNDNYSIHENIVKIDVHTINEAQKIYDEGYSLREVSKKIGISRQTLSKYLSVRPKMKDKDEIRKNNIEKVKRWKRKLKEDMVELKGGKCVVCGYNKSLRALHFHHTNPSEKDITISQNTMTKEKAIKELDKCVLVCSNCHSEIHDEICEKGFSSMIWDFQKI